MDDGRGKNREGFYITKSGLRQLDHRMQMCSERLAEVNDHVTLSEDELKYLKVYDTLKQIEQEIKDVRNEVQERLELK